MTHPSRLLSREEAAQYLNLSLRSIDALIAGGRLRPVRLGVARTLIDRGDLDTLVNQAKRESEIDIR
jgi:excisionase family DNA binding protein